MRHSRIGLATFLAAAALSAGAASTFQLRALDVIPAAEAPRQAVPKRITPDARAAWTKSHRCGPGWTCRQVQRMARKRRNRTRNKRAHRG